MDFLKELQKLRQRTPRLNLLDFQSENSAYCNYAGRNRDSYLCSSFWDNDTGYYCFTCYFNTDVVDCDICDYCELCYECINCRRCYNCDYCESCDNCIDSKYLLQCVGCQNCIGCINLHQASYHIFNEKYPKEEYLVLKKTLTKEQIEQKFLELKKSSPFIFSFQRRSENCFGDLIFDSKNCFNCYVLKKSEDVHHSHDCFNCRDCIDCTYALDCEESYELTGSISAYHCQFGVINFFSHNLEYCEYCFNSHHLFGCISLNHASYRILNQPYRQEEYFKKVAEIKAGMKKQGTYGKQLPSVYPGEDTSLRILAPIYFHS